MGCLFQDGDISAESMVCFMVFWIWAYDLGM